MGSALVPSPTPTPIPTPIPVLVLLLMTLAGAAPGAGSAASGPETPLPQASGARSVGGVVTAGGEPLAGAEVRLLPPAALWGAGTPDIVAPASTVRTGVDGEYTLPVPGPGPWAVRIEAPGRTGGETVVEVLDVPERLPPVDLPPARRVAVRIAAPEGVTGGHVAWPARRRPDALPLGRWRASAVVVPIEDGAALVSVPAGGSPVVQVVAPGAVPARSKLPGGTPAAGTVTLEPARPSTLRVVDVDGRPLAGIRIYADGGPLPVAETGADGRASAVLPPGASGTSGLLLLAPDGRSDRSRPVLLTDAPGGEVHRLRFAPPPPLTGRVVQRGTGRPLGSALAWSRPPAPGEPVRADAAGRFEMPAGHGERRTLVAAAAAHRVATVDLSGLRSETGPGAETAEVSEGVEIALSALRRATGRVVDTEDRPVAGARVRLTPVPSGRSGTAAGGDRGGVGPVRTEVDGAFALPDPSAGRFDLVVEADGFGPVTVPRLQVGEAGAGVPRGPETIDLGVVVLTAGTELAGRVVDDGGEPVPDARVLLAPDRGRPWEVVTAMEGVRREVRTDEEGDFVFTGLAPGDRVRLRARKRGFSVAEPAPVTLPSDRPVRIVLRRPSGLAGWVVDGAGRPVEGALVTAERIPGTTQEAPSPAAPPAAIGPASGGSDATAAVAGVGARTGAAGDFELHDLPAGALVARASAPGYRDGRSRVVEAAPGERVPTVEIVLRRAASLQGRVVEPGGAPVRGATVDATDPSGTSAGFGRTDGQGRFRLDGLRAGPHTLSAVGPEGREARRRVEAGAASGEVTLVLEGGAPVRGRVVRADGSPVAEARVVLVRPGGGERGAGGSVETRTGPLGRFGWSGVPDGAYHLLASTEDLSPARPVPVTVDGSPLEDLEVVLDAGVTLRGQVLGVAFDDLPEVAVRVLGAPGSTTGVDHAGVFVLPNLPAGEVVLVAELQGTGRRLVERIDLPAGASEVDASVWLPDAPAKP